VGPAFQVSGQRVHSRGGEQHRAAIRRHKRTARDRLVTAASVLFVGYGGLNVVVGALVLSGVLHPGGGVDRTALRWHVGVWDLWFLVWGILLALATVSYWRRTREQDP